MNPQTNLTREQIIFISFMGVIGNIVYIHTWIDDETNRSAWLACLIGILVIIPFAIWILYLGKFLPNKTLINIIENKIGKIPSSIIYLLYFFINILVGTTHLNMFTSMINTFFLASTPPLVIMAFLLMIGFFLVKGKTLDFARFVEILAVLGLLNYFLTFILGIPKEFNFEFVYPVFDTSLYGFLKGCLFIAGTAAETLLILIIFVRNIPSPEKHYSWVVKGVLLASVIFPLAIMIIMAMMSPELAKRIAYGGVNAARLIQLGKYIQGLEVFVLVAYQLIAIGKVTICLYCAWTSIKDLLNQHIPKILLFLTALLMLFSSSKIISYGKAYSIAVFTASYIVLPFSIFVLVIASICVKLKKD